MSDDDKPTSEAMRSLIGNYVGERVRRGEIVRITANGTRNHLNHFAASYGNRPLQHLSLAAVDRWIEQMQTEGLASATQSLRLTSLRGFAQWCAAHKHVPTDFTYGARKIRRPRHIPRDMTTDHALAVIGAARTPREHLITVLMFGAGLRCIEVSRLDVHDYDGVTHTLFVHGKGGHQRTVPVPPIVDHAIDTYLATIRAGTGPMIRCESPGTEHRRLGEGRISGLVGHLTRLAGVKVRPFDGRSAHGLRSASATELLEAAHGDMRVVQQYLGHANVATTGHYIRQVGTDKIMAAQLARPFPLQPPRAA